ncbi:hypothetical protein J4402_03090 [Candidatus Pacearchaeota archaeon]|nr:hypothetical protein [Candidatus Pacearchaeota archaeon]
MESSILNIILGLLTILSFLWSYFSEENRIIAMIIGFLLIVLIMVSEKNARIDELEIRQKKLEERLKIYERLNKLELEVEILKNAKRK